MKKTFCVLLIFNKIIVSNEKSSETIEKKDYTMLDESMDNKKLNKNQYNIIYWIVGVTVSLILLIIFCYWCYKNKWSENYHQSLLNQPSKNPLYNEDNRFWHFIMGKEKPNKLYKNNLYSIAFESINGNPLIIPKGKYMNIKDFAQDSFDKEKIDFHKTTLEIINQEKNFSSTGFCIGAHTGISHRQSIFHFHYHIYSENQLSSEEENNIKYQDKIVENNTFIAYKESEVKDNKRFVIKPKNSKIFPNIHEFLTKASHSQQLDYFDIIQKLTNQENLENFYLYVNTSASNGIYKNEFNIIIVS